MSVKDDIRRSLKDLAYPIAASYYRTNGPGDSAVPILKLLGIADASFQPTFFTLSRVIEQAADRGGIYAECGVYRGGTLLGVAHKLKTLHAKGWHLVGFDSFEGFPELVQEDALPDGSFHPNAKKGFFSDTSYEAVNARVRALGFEREITLVKGYFDATLEAWSDKRFTVVHLDCDIYQSYVTCLNFFYPRLEPGGFMVFDEYDFCAGVYPGAQKAIDGFFADKPERIQRFEDAAVPRYFIVKQPAAAL